jgi:hypothetical protein
MIVPDILLAEGDMIGDFVVLHTPGHTPGCICLYSAQDRLLFSGRRSLPTGAAGAMIFPGGAGRNLPARSTGSRRWMLKDCSQATGSPRSRTAAGASQLPRG